MFKPEMKIITFIKNHKLLVFLAIILITIISGVLFASQLENTNKQISNVESNLPNQENQTAFDSVVKPGETNLTDLNNKLGKPAKKSEKDEVIKLEYQTDNPYLFNQVYLKDDKVVLVKKPIDYKERKLATSISELYGPPQYKLYNQEDPDDAFKLYVYTDKGVAYQGHSDGTVLNMWYFEPTTLGNFILNWAQNYAQNPSTNQSY